MRRRNFFKVFPGIFVGGSLLAQSGGNNNFRRVWIYHGLEKRFEEIDWPEIKHGMLISFDDNPAIFIAIFDSVKREGVYRVDVEIWDPEHPPIPHWINRYMSSKKA